MEPARFFTHCPRCGQGPQDEPEGRVFECHACGFRLYFNVGCAVIAVLRDTEERLLFIRRAKAPGKGKLAFPGGFADPGETAEEALRRELHEEVGLEMGELEYLCSHPNPYHYRGITYPILDFAYAGVISETATHITLQTSEVTGFEWLPPAQVDPDEIAFPSMREALRVYLSHHQGNSP